jgi:thiamine pyrophosphate-dependent acetolactate synthase large subunit-like protein
VPQGRGRRRRIRLPGGANLPTYDAFYDADIKHVLVRHEAGGGHAAEGYAKATGKVGVCFATSGPGATNIVTPLTDAMMDSVPVVFFTGQVRTDLLGTDGFQEADTFGITMPIVKHSFMIQHPTEIPRVIHEAFHIARTGRPGPVLIDMPTDLTRVGDRLRAGRGRPPARLPAHHRGQPEADPPGRQGDGQRAPPGALRRRAASSTPTPRRSSPNSRRRTASPSPAR